MLPCFLLFLTGEYPTHRKFWINNNSHWIYTLLLSYGAEVAELYFWAAWIPVSLYCYVGARSSWWCLLKNVCSPWHRHHPSPSHNQWKITLLAVDMTCGTEAKLEDLIQGQLLLSLAVCLCPLYLGAKFLFFIFLWSVETPVLMRPTTGIVLFPSFQS